MSEFVSEANFMQKILLKLGSDPQIRIWRQNVGSVKIDGRYFHAGPPKGAADLSGIVSPEGWRLEIEVKGPKKKQSIHQKKWQQMIEKRGGIYAIAVYDSQLSMRDNVDLARESVFKLINSRR